MLVSGAKKRLCSGCEVVQIGGGQFRWRRLEAQAQPTNEGSAVKWLPRPRSAGTIAGMYLFGHLTFCNIWDEIIVNRGITSMPRISKAHISRPKKRHHFCVYCSLSSRGEQKGISSEGPSRAQLSRGKARWLAQASCSTSQQPLS